MTETTEIHELMVRFRMGVSEDIARAAVRSAGATVRRRMRTDFPNEVLLLVKVEPGKMGEVEERMKALPSVVSTEQNQGGFGVR
jgi:hypothetical protein